MGGPCASGTPAATRAAICTCLCSASGIRAGAHVLQGQIIGRVGSTGLATGPHLHYELKKAGATVNPLAEHRKLPPGEPVPPDQLDAFKAERDKAMARLQLDGQT